ncbi:MAG: response regulator, partial [candidate division Zixibacteria bacterium]|nr:response regulator [candidate division Zixibacteria bacterium]
METNEKPVIAVVDDDELMREAHYETFIDDYEVKTFASGPEILEALGSGVVFNAVIMDIKMAKMDGLKTASEIQKSDGDLPIIFCTGYPGDYSERDIDSALKPFEYMIKTERPVKLQRAVRNAVAMNLLKKGKGDLVKIARDNYKMIGRSRAMVKIYETIEKIAQTEAKVMVLGPTGTGKELVARAIHRQSNRVDKRLVIFNCNHKSPDLVESELFGHIKGAFTGAIADRIGSFEYADGGTLFLDEVGDLDITTQAKILRVLESGEFSRIGSNDVINTDVRLICATNCDLQAMISKGKFRQDLYYRLKQIVINLPPLSERTEDIPELVHYFIERLHIEKGYPYKVFESRALDLLCQHSWPGNVRDLFNAVEGMVSLTSSSLVTAEDVAGILEGDDTGSQYIDMHGLSLAERIRKYEASLIGQTLAQTNYNISAASRMLKTDRNNLRKKIKSLGIEIEP